jgi:hypothetical protein
MSAITEIVSVVQPQSHSRSFRSSIALPVTGEKIYGDRLEVEGWGGAQRTALDIPRHDLVDAYPDLNGEPIGFSFVLAAPRLPSYELLLRVVSARSRNRHARGALSRSASRGRAPWVDRAASPGAGRAGAAPPA